MSYQKIMYVEYFYADLGVHAEKIKNNTGFEIDISQAKPSVIANNELSQN
jgi:hypothetical protein